MKIFTIFLSSILNFQLLDSPGNTTDTLTIHPITFSTTSPEGWNAHYQTIAPFPDTDDQWAKILMVQTLKCDSLTTGNEYLDHKK
ncbi:MAG TPA: hypothetical protein EYN29_00885 [Candidatus Marinimicrobia bacterium]|nr:hypothetical protein [Candidatus Neomarinimicrobiota bacterium]